MIDGVEPEVISIAGLLDVQLAALRYEVRVPVRVGTGAAADPGIWMKTPLVDSPGKGRVEYPAKGTTVAVDLIPLDAEPGSGSQLSLAAMRLLEADLTGLPEVRVFATGN